MNIIAPTGRFYKSRKRRPCDHCRKRKGACNMPKGPPCLWCSSKSISCTFEDGPEKRRRERTRTSPLSEGGTEQDQFPIPQVPLTSLNDSDSLTSPPDGPWPQDRHRLMEDHMMADLTRPQDSPAIDCEPGSMSHWSVSSSLGFILQEDDQNGEQVDHAHDTVDLDALVATGSLEDLPGAFSFYIGPTGVADIHLLQRQEFDINNVTHPKLAGLKYRQLDKPATDTENISSHPAIFGITDQKLLKNAEPKVKAETIEEAWAELWRLLDHSAAWRLIKLYTRFIDPHFPVLSIHQIPLSPEELSNMPLCLLTAMCALALPFVVYDESLYALLLHPPSSERLYKLCWLDISQQFHAPTLATLQSCLLFQQRLPTNPYLSDTAFAWTLISSAVAVAQTMGLHRSSSAWRSVPRWERSLRKRLWWALWVTERWVAFARGMPSHLNPEESDVEDLRPEDFIGTLSCSIHTTTHLPQLVRLTKVLADVNSIYYTVKATSATSDDLHLSLELARTLKARLKEWRDELPPSIQFPPRDGLELSETRRLSPGQKDLDGNGAIHLSCIVTHMTLLRALLRPLDRWEKLANGTSAGVEAMTDGAKAVIRGSLLCVKDFVEFMECLSDTQWNAFWHSWSRPNFAIAGSFMVYLLHITTSFTRFEVWFEQQDEELVSLLGRWRVANRVSANGAAGVKGLSNLGLLRVETMLRDLLAARSNKQ